MKHLNSQFSRSFLLLLLLLALYHSNQYSRLCVRDFLLSTVTYYSNRTQLNSTHLVRMAESGYRKVKEVSFQNDWNGKNEFDSAEPDYAEIIVVRHGETAWDADGIVQGQLNVELNDNGRRQAFAVAERLSVNPKISFVYTSDLMSSVATAHIIASRCGGAKVIEDPDLRERHYGDLQGLKYMEFETVSPEAYNAFRSNNTDQEIPGGGESRDQFRQRCVSCLWRIGCEHRGEIIVVVTDAGVIKLFHERSSSAEEPPAKMILNTSVSIFLLSDGFEWILTQWNDASHLPRPRGRPRSESKMEKVEVLKSGSKRKNIGVPKPASKRKNVGVPKLGSITE